MPRAKASWSMINLLFAVLFCRVVDIVFGIDILIRMRTSVVIKHRIFTDPKVHCFALTVRRKFVV